MCMWRSVNHKGVMHVLASNQCLPTIVGPKDPLYDLCMYVISYVFLFLFGFCLRYTSKFLLHVMILCTGAQQMITCSKTKISLAC